MLTETQLVMRSGDESLESAVARLDGVELHSKILHSGQTHAVIEDPEQSIGVAADSLREALVALANELEWQEMESMGVK